MSFEENFLYPLGLLLVGGSISGILIPWYTSRQKAKQNELDRSKEDAEKLQEQKRLDNQKELEKIREERDKTIERMRRDRELEIQRERQDFQFKIKLKQELIEAFHDYRISGISAINNFYGLIFDYYASTPLEFDKDLGLSRARLEMPSTNKTPDKVFGKKWIELQESMVHQISDFSNLFLLKLAWYSDNESLAAEFESLRKGTINVIDLMTNIIKSKNVIELDHTCREFYSKLHEYDEAFDGFRLKLVKSQITKLSV